MNKVLAQIYRSPRHQGMYLYVTLSEKLARVPGTLLEHFGEPQEAMRLLLDGERNLAHADVSEVLLALEERGFYLQMSPGEEHPEMTAITLLNDKLYRVN